MHPAASRGDGRIPRARPQERQWPAGFSHPERALTNLRHFVVPGFQRCGTTTLTLLADEHPAIRMARPLRPEPKFFLSPRSAEEYPAYLERFFATRGEATVLGEKSTSYSDDPSAPERIESLLSGFRAVFLLRDPIARALSNYSFSRDHGLEDLDPGPALKTGEDRPLDLMAAGVSTQPRDYIRRGRYIDTLEHWQSKIGRDRILVLFLEELARSPQVVCRQLFEFLEVVPDFVPPSLGVVANTSKERFDLSGEPGLRSYLESVFEGPNRRLSEYLGRDLPFGCST